MKLQPKKASLIILTLVFALMCNSNTLWGFNGTQDTLRVEVLEDNSDAATPNIKVAFTLRLKKLEQLVGAPPPYYQITWEFGDGNNMKDTVRMDNVTTPFFDHIMEYTYNNRATFDPRLFVTAIYGDGGPPPAFIVSIDDDFTNAIDNLPMPVARM